MLNDRDTHFLERALNIGKRGLFTTKPNPRVGCVIAKDGNVIAEGWHKYAGDQHAEIIALEEAGANASGADVFVSLEPCSHFGKTGPCTEALIKANVKRVVVAMRDPNAESGNGLEALKKSGIKIDIAGKEIEKKSIDLNPGFFKRMKNGEPFVRLKIAATMDGRIAAPDSSSRWITTESARKDVHALRARSCAVVTGMGTVRADNPQLTARLSEEIVQPLRVIVGKCSEINKNLKIFSDDGRICLCSSTPLQDQKDKFNDKTEFVDLSRTDENIFIKEVLKVLSQRQCNEILVEAGPKLAGCFMKASVVDEVWVYQSPDILGSSSYGMFDIQGIHNISDKLKLKLVSIKELDRDLRLVYKPD